MQIDFWYPTDVSRPYMPDPKRNFEAFAASLEQVRLQGRRRTARRGARTTWAEVNEGKAGALNLIGWTGDYGDPDNFVGTFFQAAAARSWGSRTRRSSTPLDKAEVETDVAKRTELYQEANREIMKFLPGVPYVHTKPALGVRRRTSRATSRARSRSSRSRTVSIETVELS